MGTLSSIPRRFKPRLLVKTVAASATPEALGSSLTRMNGMTFFGQKAAGTDNTGNVTIQMDGQDAMILTPGAAHTWPMPTWEGAYYLASDFTIKVATNGDGVVVVYADLQ